MNGKKEKTRVRFLPFVSIWQFAKIKIQNFLSNKMLPDVEMWWTFWIARDVRLITANKLQMTRSEGGGREKRDDLSRLTIVE